MIETNKSILKKVYPPRESFSRKYDFGIVLVIGGSEFYSGSPALSAMAAFRAGVDMARVIAPQRAADIIASFSPNIAAYPLEGKWLTKKHLATLVTMTESAKIVARGNAAVVIGGGAGRSKETKEVILEYLSKVSVPAVIDADAIHAVSEKPEIIAGKNFLILPHSYEFLTLTGKEIRELSDKERIEMVKQEASRLNTTIILKGVTDIISNGKETVLNKTGTPNMTVGGCGDTLAGICGALMARHLPPMFAGQAGAYINGRAGEIASLQKRDGMLATDLIEAIPEAISS